jgi:hypothetical protein
MGDERVLTIHRKKAALVCMFTAALMLTSVMAAAQDAASPDQKAPEKEGYFATISRWFKEQTSTVNSSFEGARKKVEGFSSAAGDAARSTVQGAKDAAGAVARIPAARAISGHEQCQVAANGAPDCVAAANTMCKAKGFSSGSSLDMTTAEVCPPKVYMSGRSSANECKMETFVSRAFCQ